MAQRLQLGALHVPQIAAPAAPAAGTLLYTNNGALYAKSAAGVETTVGAGAPTGSGMEWYAATPPTGWLMQDWGEYPIATYAELYNVLTAGGTVFPFGANTNGSGGAGSTHFRTPPRSGRVAVGVDAAQAEFNTLGEVGGEKAVALTIAQLASHTHVQNAHTHTQDAHNHTQNSHNHTQNSHNHSQNSHNHAQNPHSHSVVDFSVGAYQVNTAGSWAYGYSNTGATTAVNQAATATNIAATATNIATTATNIAATAVNQNATATNQSAGGGEAHNNLQPYIVVNFIIKT